jgi:enterochelin esterase-like enzyme|tara:strand:+ start:1652 stop:1897 length:246 start_codon:yes stop_codon:yes gene_type:complete
MRNKKKLESVSICTVVSFGRSSRCALKIAIAHTVGSRVTLTNLGGGRRGGTTFTPNRNLKQMLETNGLKATEVTQENGNEL